MRVRQIIFAARALSLLFHPLYWPLVGLVVLFTATYLAGLPLLYKLWVLGVIALFTIALPSWLIRIYRHYQGWTPFELGARERRMVPYALSIAAYMLCTYVLESAHAPHFLATIVIIALLIQIACAVANAWWKVSVHCAAAGGMTGAVAGFSLLFGFNPVWWLALLVLLAGVIGTCRMLLRQHTLGQCVGGFLTGVAIAAAGAVVI